MVAQNPLAEIASHLDRYPDTRFVDVLLADSCGIPRGKRLTIEELPGVYRGGFLLPGSMFALDVLGDTIQATGLGFDEGDADRPCLPLPGSLLPVPWVREPVAQLQVAMHERDGRPFFGDPRHVLANVVDRFTQLGLQPVVAIELEFYFVDRERTAAGAAQPPAGPESGRREHRIQINSMSDLDEFSPLLSEISSYCEIQQVPTGTALAEYGPGQYEVNLHHVADACLACDHAIRLKRIVHGVAMRHGMEATFMPKPYADMAGSGAHIHVSLLDRSGRNVFASEDPAGSEALRHAIGGLAAHMADSMLVFAPTINAYRRFRPEAYVPLTASWGINNRGVALRVPVSDADNRRIEHRVAGADANPYLLTACVLAAMLDGLDNRLDPGAPVNGNAYRNTPDLLPHTWPDTLRAFRQSPFIREYLGADFQRLYSTTRHGEFRSFEAQVSALDHQWYLRC
jgi:glutamine synthetase